MIAFHLVSELVDFVLYLVGESKRGHVHLMVRLHGGVVETADEGVHLVNLLERVVGETHLMLAEAVGVLDDVLGVVADAFQVADRADGGDKVLVVKLTELVIGKE